MEKALEMGKTSATGSFQLLIGVATARATAYVIGNMFAMLGSLSSSSLLSGLGETKILLKQSLLTLSFGLPLGFLLISTLGIWAS